MDLETAMMAVQSNRANLLETQLKDQISSVQAKNDQISKMNQLLGSLNKAAAMFGSDAKADTRIDGNSQFANGGAYNVEKEVNSAYISAGITNPGLSDNKDGGGGLTNTLKADGSAARLEGGLRGDVTKGKLDGAIQQIKSQPVQQAQRSLRRDDQLHQEDAGQPQLHHRQHALRSATRNNDNSIGRTPSCQLSAMSMWGA
ncbi:hypothetical protein ASF19_24585 [Acidovorax sp. Leaf84]|nr:hypothetical protein ASF19_24585 [Acidovorax sp. Leaf84]